jgi:hypothetical protein
MEDCMPVPPVVRHQPRRAKCSHTFGPGSHWLLRNASRGQHEIYSISEIGSFANLFCRGVQPVVQPEKGLARVKRGRQPDGREAI